MRTSVEKVILELFSLGKTTCDIRRIYEESQQMGDMCSEFLTECELFKLKCFWLMKGCITLLLMGLFTKEIIASIALALMMDFCIVM